MEIDCGKRAFHHLVGRDRVSFARLVDARSRSAFLLARAVAITPGRQARSELVGGLYPVTGAPSNPRAPRLRLHQRGEAAADHAKRLALGALR